jgi:hypothetical protein
MFFLIRCLFWLGMVFSQIATIESGGASHFAPQAARSVTALSQNALKTAVQAGAEAATRHCASDPAACLSLAAQVTRKAASHDTLQAGDRAPAWRLRPGKTDDARHSS